MDPALRKMFDLQWFHENDFQRKECSNCGNFYWTLDEDATDCGDSTCREYTFLGKPLSKKPLSIPEMREAFLSFWEAKDHARVRRNPVVARWRDDLYLNIASIANYQPHVTSGEVPPPANPLVVSQPCIRLNDLSNIGRSGRHFSCFEMMGHHAFNSSEWGEHYWTEECTARGHEFLTDILGLDPKSLTYVEAEWSGGGNAGPCLEVFAGGLEVATLVFMCLELVDGGPDDPAAEFTIKGDGYRMMDLRIIDTGWGLERLAWASTGTPSAYETVFPDTLAELRAAATVPIADDDRSAEIVAMHARVQGVLNIDIGMSLDGLRQEVVARLSEHGIETRAAELEQVMGPVEDLYALADHLRCLSFMVGDGIVPGNAKAGYLMRLVYRRAFRFRDNLGIDTPLSDLLAANMERLVPEFPEFQQAIARAREMTDLEQERFIESRDRGLRLVERVLKDKGDAGLGQDDLVDLYDTHGLGPTTVASAAERLGIPIDIPDTFDALIAERHAGQRKAKPKATDFGGAPPTELLFYDDQDTKEFEATVVWTAPAPKGADHAAEAALDKTAFFWETGGQPGDRGTLAVDGAATPVRVVGMRKDGDHAIHLLDGPIEVGATVRGIVDWDLRMDHTRSHTATHIMNQAVRRVLGNHSWQAGTQKYADCARVDMTHFRRPSQEELDAIELLANRVVMEGREVTRTWMDRGEAEHIYGMQLLQGGIPKGRKVRVVAIAGRGDEEGPWDIEYCGGTHCHTTNEVGPINLWRTERIQDGVERFEYSAGPHAIERWQAQNELARSAATELSVSPNELPQAAKRFFTEWKEQRKLLDEVQKQLAELKAAAAAGAAEEIGGIRIIVDGAVDASALQGTAQELLAAGKTVALLAAPPAGGNGPARLLFGRSPDVNVDMGAVLRDAAAIMGGKGGGRPDFAQGAGPDAGKLDEAMQAARDAVAAALA